MCGRCPELMGESEPYDPADAYDEYEWRCDSPCDRCDSPCEKCREDECVLGPDISDRPDYQHMKDLCFDPETGTYPDLAMCQKDYYHEARECGFNKFCLDPHSMCPDYERGEP